MKILFLRFFRALWNDEAAARGLIRGTLHAFALGGATYADQIATAINAPHLVGAIRLAAFTAVFLGGNLVAGQSNPPAQGGQP